MSKWRTGTVSTVAALTCLIAFSGAQGEPAPLPQTDFTAAWDLSGTPDQMGGSRITYSAELGKMRIDMNAQGQDMTIVRDMNSGQATMWSQMMPGMAMQMDQGERMRLEGQRTGQMDEVNGEPCEIWNSQGSQVCVTEDGIPVRSMGEGVTATMTGLDRSPQDTSLFEVPAGLQVMAMPKGMPGMAPGAGMPGMKLPF